MTDYDTIRRRRFAQADARRIYYIRAAELYLDLRPGVDL